MKYKILGLIMCVCILIVSLCAPLAFADNTGRVHQHLEAEEKTECSHGDESFCTHLPLLVIDTGNREIPGDVIYDENEAVTGYTTAADGEKTILAKIRVVDSETANNHITDEPVYTSDMRIRIRGNTSRTFDKKNYAIRLTTEDGENNPLPLLGMDAHHEWALHGPYLDKTLMRNYMWYNIAGEIMDYAPNVRFCEMVLDGEYMGVYVLTETITKGDDGARLHLEVDAKNQTFSGYLLRLDRPEKVEDNPLAHAQTFTTYAMRTKNALEIIYPGTSNLTSEIANGIRQDFSDFEKALYSYDFDNETYGYTKLIDVDSFVDYFILNEVTCNYDAGWLSTYIYKDVNGLFKMCIWDFNSACDNYQESMITPNHFEMQSDLWYFMLMKDEDFTDRIIERYRELRKKELSEEYLFQYIDDVTDYLGPAIERNFEKWGYSFADDYDLLKPSSRNPHSHAEAVEDMKKFLTVRLAWMDENIEILRQYSAESKIKKFNENAN